MYLTPTENTWACDIEADNLLDKATKIWCVCLENVSTGETFSTTTAVPLLEWLGEHPDAVFVGHNFIAYDLVMLNRHWFTKIPASRVVDTFVLSQLYKPTLTGGHSLREWGARLRFPKGEFHDFSEFSEDMLKYCRQDTSLTARLFNRLSQRMRGVGFTEDGCEIEHLAWNIIQNKQRRVGFPFNKKKALELYVLLRQREEELKDEIYKLWPPRLSVVGRFARSRKSNGEHTTQYLRHLGQYKLLKETDDGGYEAIDYVCFNLGSPSQRIQKLLELGWTPSEYTKKTRKGGGGNPKVDEDSLLAYADESGKREVAALAKWIVVNSRANMINTWLNAYDEETGAIHGRLFIASTLRYRHSNPNSANIPAVRQYPKGHPDEGKPMFGEDGAWTYECRDLWYSGDPDFLLVGVDGTGIQNRCLVHNLIKTVGEEAVREFKELALEGDIHRHNIDVLGLANKAAAKKFYYSLMMGAGGAKLASDQAQFGTRMTAKEGEEKKAMLIASIPGFGDLIDRLVLELGRRKGRITLCDGTPIVVPSPHMVIPYLLQGDESRIMKRVMIYIDQEIRRNGLSEDVLKVADIHDESQFKVRRQYVERFVEIALPCFERAGESFDYTIPISGDAKPGETWAETH